MYYVPYLNSTVFELLKVFFFSLFQIIICFYYDVHVITDKYCHFLSTFVFLCFITDSVLIDNELQQELDRWDEANTSLILGNTHCEAATEIEDFCKNGVLNNDNENENEGNKLKIIHCRPAVITPLSEGPFGVY